MNDYRCSMCVCVCVCVCVLPEPPGKYHSYMEPKNHANELICKAKIDSQTQKTNLRLLKGESEQVGKRDKLTVWDLQICTTIYIDKQVHSV